MSDRLRVVTFKLEERKLEILDMIAYVEGTTRSDIIRKALDMYIEWWRKRNTPRYKVVRLTS